MTKRFESGLKAFILCFLVVPALILTFAVMQRWAAAVAPPAPEQRTATPPAASAPSTTGVGTIGGGLCSVRQLVGFHPPETWGVWSETDPATIELAQEVSGKVHLRIVAYTIADGRTHQATIALGDVRRTIDVNAQLETHEMDLDLPKPVSQIAIGGIAPRSPQELGISLDSRRVGVGLVKIDCEAVK